FQRVVGEELGHQLTEAVVELPSAAACFRENKAALLDILLKKLLLDPAQARILMAVEVDNGGLQQIAHQSQDRFVARRFDSPRIKDLPGHGELAKYFLAG